MRLFHLIFITFVVLGLAACHEFQPQSLTASLNTPRQTPLQAPPPAPEPMDTICVPLKEHQVKLQVPKNAAQLPPKQVQQLNDWWDSLPNNVRTQIQQKEIGIKVLTQGQQTSQQTQQAETTGQALEKIIGPQTQVSYTAQTYPPKPNPNNKEELSSQTQDEQATTVLLAKKVPVKLSNYATDIYLKQDYLNNDNIQTLQYWWLSLPESLKDKIRRGELTIHLRTNTLDHEYLDKTGHKRLGLAAERHAELLSSVLQDLIGYQEIGSRKEPLGRIHRQFRIRRATASQAPNLYHIELQLEPSRKPALIQIQ